MTLDGHRKEIIVVTFMAIYVSEISGWVDYISYSTLEFFGFCEDISWLLVFDVERVQ